MAAQPTDLEYRSPYCVTCRVAEPAPRHKRCTARACSCPWHNRGPVPVAPKPPATEPEHRHMWVWDGADRVCDCGARERALAPPKPEPVAPHQVVWEDPPAGRRNGRHFDWVEYLQPLVAKPGVWARICTYEQLSTASARAAKLRRGAVNLPAGRWEFVSGRVGTDAASRAAVWARYLGPDTPT